MTDWLTAQDYAHRGLHGRPAGAVENSLSAFRAARAAGHGFELDVLLSGDGVPMVFHDSGLKRLTGRAGRVGGHTAAELRDMSLRGSRDTLPTLQEVLQDTAGQIPVLAELKGDQGQPKALAAATYEVLRPYTGPVAVMSFDERIIAWFRDNAPQVPRGLVATARRPLLRRGHPKAFYAPARHIELLRRLEADFLAYDIRSLPNAATEYCRQKGIPVLTWTVRTPKEHRRAEEVGATKIFEVPA